MAKVFLTVLGTNNYIPVIYSPLPGEPKTPETPYVQEARLQALMKTVGIDRVIIAITGGEGGSEARNYRQRATASGPEPDGLESRVRDLGTCLEPTGLLIPDGATEAQLWEIFQTLDAAIDDGDELFVDVTHGFRSLPIVLLTTLSYLQRARKVTVEQVSYGAFETKPRDSKEPRPTFDLTPFFVLEEWSSALVLLDAGDLRALGRVLTKPSKDLGRILRRNNPPSLSRLPGSLVMLGDDLWCNRLRDIPGHLESTLSKLRSLNKDFSTLTEQHHEDEEIARVVGSLQPLRSVLARLEHEIGKMEPEPGDPQVAYGVLAARFCIEHGLVVQGLTLLRESLLDHLVELLSLEDLDRREVDAILGTLAAVHQGSEIDMSRLDPSIQPATRRLHQPPNAVVGDERAYQRLCKLSHQIADLRNSLNHAGTVEGQGIPSTDRLREKGLKYVVQVLEHLRSNDRPTSPTATT